MNIKENNRQELIEHLKQNYIEGQSWKTSKFLFGFTPEQARKIWLNYRKKHKISPSKKEGVIKTSVLEDIGNGKKEVTYTSPTEIKNLEDLRKLIDTESWEIKKYVQNYWAGRYQVKAWLEPKETKEIEILEKLLKNYKSNWKPINSGDKIKSTVWNKNSLLVINLNDLHFDKLDLVNNTIEKRIEDYHTCLKTLLFKAYHSNKLEEIVFVVGNDVFNTDNIQSSTTNGTPQDINSTWDYAYEKVFDAMVSSISTLKQFSHKLNVILVQGNHDRTKSYYLAHALETYFKIDNSISFDRTTNPKKVFVYGNTFIGFNHGNNINDKLPLAFATEFYKEWGVCKYHDILISDKHHNNEKVFKSNQTQNEFQGVKLRILPSLSGTDRWHNDKLYNSRQSGVALVYDKEFGKCAEFEYQL